MFITHLKLRNWRNFRDAEMNLTEVTYLLGPNASGKSNLLDVFRFLRDIAKPEGGGLQKAIKDRGGLSQLRCFHARHDPEVLLEVHLAERIDDTEPLWRYELGFKSEGKRLLIKQETVHHRDQDRPLLNRPDKHDKQDPELLTETHLEQTRANRDFRDIASHFATVTYLHLVPQLLKFSNRIGGNRLEDDPFGQGFLERLANCPKKTRANYLKKISKSLSQAVPQFKDLRYQTDAMGHPHLEALYQHHRPNAGWQNEEQFSDGTLRLLGILWSLLDGRGLLLLEEPELSLHQAVVEKIPRLIQRLQQGRTAKTRRQIIISTHSEALLSNKGIDWRGVNILELVKEGTQLRGVNKAEEAGLEAGLSVADAVLPQTRPQGAEQLGLWD